MEAVFEWRSWWETASPRGGGSTPWTSENRRLFNEAKIYNCRAASSRVFGQSTINLGADGY
jgi:hypothetical protein